MSIPRSPQPCRRRRLSGKTLVEAPPCGGIHFKEHYRQLHRERPSTQIRRGVATVCCCLFECIEQVIQVVFKRLVVLDDLMYVALQATWKNRSTPWRFRTRAQRLRHWCTQRDQGTSRVLLKCLPGGPCTKRGALWKMQHPTTTTELKPCVLLTNDDGVESVLLLRLAAALEEQYALDVVVIAPKTNQSACSHRLTLATPMELVHRADLKTGVYSLAGSPADCVITAIEPNGLLARLGKCARVVVSGPNLGANLAQDILHSGTFSGARQAGFYGLPAVAFSLAGEPLQRDSQEACVQGAAFLVSLLVERLPLTPPNAGRLDPCRSLHLHGRSEHGSRPGLQTSTASGTASSVRCTPRRHCDVCGKALAPATEVNRSVAADEDAASEDALDLVWSAFCYGDLVLNVNFPARWHWGRWRTTHLGAIFYRDVFQSGAGQKPDSAEMVIIGAEGRPEPLYGFVNSDLVAIREGYASVTTLQTWPESHPLQANERIVEAMAVSDPQWGLPAWITLRLSPQELGRGR